MADSKAMDKGDSKENAPPSSARTAKTTKTSKSEPPPLPSQSPVQKVTVYPRTPTGAEDIPRLPIPPATPGRAQIARIPSPSSDSRIVTNKIALQREASRLKNPHNAVRMTTVSMSARAKASTDIRRSYEDGLRGPRKVISLDEALSARPPLPMDLDGPTAWSYSPHIRKPLKETNSPAWSFGRRTFVEKPGGSRTSWEKTWFQNHDVWSQKANFHSDKAWPAPTTYKSRPTLGPRQRTIAEYPAYSIGVRRSMSFDRKGANKEPAPNQYDKQRADVIVLNRAPAFSVQRRRQGTVLWGGAENTPGPGRYSPQTARVQVHNPAFTICGIRREKTHEFGPFATF